MKRPMLNATVINDIQWDLAFIVGVGRMGTGGKLKRCVYVGLSDP